MFSKLIFVLATVCVVNTSVLTVLKADAVSDNLLSNVEDSVSPRKCTHEACNTLCHKLKFREGVCIAGRCRCNYYFPIPNDENALDKSDTLDKNFLSDSDPSLSTEDLVSDESLPVSELSEDPTKRGCNPQACHQLCRKIKQPGGVCVNGRCKCDLFFRTEDAVDEYSELDTRRVCRITKCNRTCTRRGYENATCVQGRCKCYNISKTPLPVSELSEDLTERSCNVQACNQLCRRLKFPGGVCVNGRCKCDHFLETEELDTRRVCNLRQCNRTCTRRGYAGARCVNGWCKCHDKIQREDASPLDNVTSDENEESYDEEEPTATASLDCNIFTCTKMCYHIKYDFGWCWKGKCECYKNK